MNNLFLVIGFDNTPAPNSRKSNPSFGQANLSNPEQLLKPCRFF